MNAQEVRKLDDAQITAEIKDLRTQVLALRTRASTDKVDDNSQFKKVRRGVARLLTERTARRAAAAAQK